MTYPPPDGFAPNNQQPPWPTGEPHPAGAQAPEAPGTTRTGRRRRGLLVTGVVAGTVVLGGTGFAVAQYLSGGGPQPEDVLPRDTIAFAKLDFDPAANQKTALFSLLQKFPSLGEGDNADGDLKDRLFSQLLDGDGYDLDYDADVEPWLGDRMAVALVPAPDSEAGVAPVFALAVTDEQAMADTLSTAQDDADFGFAVRGDYVLLAQSQDTADRVAAEEDSLSDDSTYDGDRAALDGDQIAVAWADLSAAQSVLEQNPAFAGAPGAMGLGSEQMSGRLIVGVHAEDDALQIEGLDFSVSDLGNGPAGEPTRLVHDLPADTLAALSVSGAGEALVKGWSDMEQSGALSGFEEQIAALGLNLPDDLRAVLGTDLAVAAFGQMLNPHIGIRVDTEEPERAIGIVDRLLSDPQLGVPAYSSQLSDGYVVATSPDAADVLGGDGDLGETDAFQAAVVDPDEATAIGFVDLAAIVDQLGEQDLGGGFEASDYAALDALGFSAGSTPEGGRFVLRITTR